MSGCYAQHSIREESRSLPAPSELGSPESLIGFHSYVLPFRNQTSPAGLPAEISHQAHSAVKIAGSADLPAERIISSTDISVGERSATKELSARVFLRNCRGGSLPECDGAGEQTD